MAVLGYVSKTLPVTKLQQPTVLEVKTFPSFPVAPRLSTVGYPPSNIAWKVGTKVRYTARSNGLKYEGVVLGRRHDGRGWVVKLDIGMQKDVDDGDAWRIEPISKEPEAKLVEAHVAPVATVQLPIQTASVTASVPGTASPSAPLPIWAASPAPANPMPAVVRAYSPGKRKVFAPMPAGASMCIAAAQAVVPATASRSASSGPLRIASPGVPVTISSICAPDTKVLQLTGVTFNPEDAGEKARLTALLRLPNTAVVTRVKQFQGGINEGIWSVDGGKDSQLILKLVRGERVHPQRPSEAERFEILRTAHPGIVQDEALAFPIQMLACHGASGQKIYDLIVMRKAPGICLANHLAKWHAAAMAKAREVEIALDHVGSCLAGIHSRYRHQHGDFTPSNVFYEESTGRVTLIDMSTMCEEVQEKDLKRFENSLRRFNYDEKFKELCVQALHKGYGA